MSIEERRHRNKLASAKYRAKKQANIKTISSKVSELMESNSELSDELNRVKQENAVLRAMCEKMMAQNPSLAHQDAFNHAIL
ncbi:hypothetical protein K501DRAFT_200047 [Backusella circina FSU 941]|nr:hypothetical protein K501DRAFT_200047 [Backusella circina FSU 941]